RPYIPLPKSTPAEASRPPVPAASKAAVYRPESGPAERANASRIHVVGRRPTAVLTRLGRAGSLVALGGVRWEEVASPAMERHGADGGWAGPGAGDQVSGELPASAGREGAGQPTRVVPARGGGSAVRA